MEADLNYYKRRSAEEAAAAAAASSETAREAHLELARRYDQQVAKIDVELRRSGFHLVSAA
jgi:hypothetical protein